MAFLQELNDLLDIKTVDLSDDENDARLTEKEGLLELTDDFKPKAKKAKKTATELDHGKYAGKEVNFDDIRKQMHQPVSDDEQGSELSSDDEVDQEAMELIMGGESDSEGDGNEDADADSASDQPPKPASDDEVSESADDEDDEDLDSVSSKPENDINLYQSNDSTLKSAQFLNINLQLIENLYNCRIKLEKVMKSQIIDEEQPEKYLKTIRGLQQKFDEVATILSDISASSNSELIETTFERTKTHGNFSKLEKSPNTQIQEILSDKDRLIKRTQRKRKNPALSKENDEYDPAIFNDTDFYADLLKQFISSKSYKDDLFTDPTEITRRWLELQKDKKRNKEKFLITSKDRKGKKINYKVHSKLVNFVAPDEKYAPTYTHEGRNALFCSLFQ